MENILEFQNVTYAYNTKSQKVNILDNTSYTFKKGTIYAIVGPSGTGKTTTMVLAGGLDSPKDGKIIFKDQELKKIGYNNYRCNDISIVFQSYNLIYYMNALENVENALNIAKKKIPNKKEYCMSILEKLGLSKDECKRDIRRLSGGQQQRVAIARSIAKDVDLILADEPTGNLDEKNSQDILDIFLDLAHKEGKCVIIVTHSPDLARQCDEQLKLKDGKIVKI
ncbi:MAG: ABC transporter ATP-binding protein [Thomasclavelia sp.]|jgi:putative ABC transport system ATP-binding protein|nr:ABC transporter ATP-binding protein [Thomasclavelia sp.]